MYVYVCVNICDNVYVQLDLDHLRGSWEISHICMRVIYIYVFHMYVTYTFSNQVKITFLVCVLL